MLFDENVNRRLKRFFGEGSEVRTVAERVNSNGELTPPRRERVRCLLTTDKGIPHQQNLAAFDLAVVLLHARSNSYDDPLMEEAIAALASAASGTVTRIPPESARTEPASP